MALAARMDLATRWFWRVAGRPVELRGEHSWLAAPMHTDARVGDAWLRAAADAVGGDLREHDDAGLLGDFGALGGSTFDARAVDERIVDFYEHTSRWRMEVWTQWTVAFQPAGELVSRLFARRIEQLALPTRPLDVARGVDSRVIPIVTADGVQHAAGWLRTLRATGDYVFSGCYSTRTLPGSAQPSVHVAFPLEEGNLQVFLRPRALPGGGLLLTSPRGSFGADGAYVTAVVNGRTYAARVPLHEEFRIFLDAENVLRTDHVLRLWSAPVIRLHYKLTPRDVA